MNPLHLAALPDQGPFVPSEERRLGFLRRCLQSFRAAVKELLEPSYHIRFNLFELGFPLR